MSCAGSWRAQSLRRRIDLAPELRVLDRDADAAREGRQKLEVVVGERAATALVHRLEDAERPALADERRREHRARRDAARAIDRAVEARMRRHVVHAERLARLEHRAGDAFADREAEPEQAFGHVGVLLRDVREVELLLLVIDQQHRRALGVQDFPAAGHDELDQAVELAARGERATELVEQPQPGGVRGHPEQW
jgi:hypothetical protein